MFIQSIKQHVGRARHSVRAVLTSAAILLTVAGVFVARTAFAKIVYNTIGPVGIVADKGRHITLTGPLAATAGDRIELRVTVTQRSTGAVAEGHTFISGTTNQWEVEARAEGGATFEAGPAIAVALARTTVGGKATDAHQWLVNLTLVQE
jgi:hypothetical protein